MSTIILKLTVFHKDTVFHVVYSFRCSWNSSSEKDAYEYIPVSKCQNLAYSYFSLRNRLFSGFEIRGKQGEKVAGSRLIL